MSAEKKSEKNTVLKKDELVSGIAEATGETKTTVAKVIDAYPQVVTAAILANLPKKNEITAVPLPGFGTLGVKYRPAEERLNNFTGEKVHVAAHYVPTFKITKTIKVQINQEVFAKKAATKVEPAKAKKTA